jgi:hypothetical protein
LQGGFDGTLRQNYSAVAQPSRSFPVIANKPLHGPQVTPLHVKMTFKAMSYLVAEYNMVWIW